VKIFKVALVVHKIRATLEDNIDSIKNAIHDAADNHADLVLFSETALTGLTNTDDPKHDITLGIEITSAIIINICNCAKEKGIYVALGFFEREGNSLYDTAILIDRSGHIILTYRRMSQGWHDPRIKNDIYKEGDAVTSATTEFGKICFLICGDLFDDRLAQLVKDQGADIMLYPFARGFEDRSYDTDRWVTQEIPDYAEQIKKAGALSLGTNYIFEEYFGGAFVISKEGQLLGSYDLGIEGIFYFDVEQ